MAKDVYVIAEIGSNHNGSIETAMKLIDMATLAGANAVKFQKRSNRTLFTEEMYNRPYDGYGPTYGQHREALEFDFSQFETLRDYAASKKVDFLVTPFDVESVEFLEILGVKQYKVASASVTNLILIEAIAKTGKPVIMSAGGQSANAVARAAYYLDRFAILHCVAAYPCPPEMMNLRRITVFKEIFGCPIGLSDHQDGIALGPAAYALGARIFEKHITLDHSAKGTDHAFSLEFFGFMQYIKYLNQTAEALVWYDQPMEQEIAPIAKMGQSLYWARDLQRGTVIEVDDVAVQSPQHPDGPFPSPILVRMYAGRVLVKTVNKGTPVDIRDLYSMIEWWAQCGA